MGSSPSPAQHKPSLVGESMLSHDITGPRTGPREGRGHRSHSMGGKRRGLMVHRSVRISCSGCHKCQASLGPLSPRAWPWPADTAKNPWAPPGHKTQIWWPQQLSQLPPAHTTAMATTESHSPWEPLRNSAPNPTCPDNSQSQGAPKPQTSPASKFARAWTRCPKGWGLWEAPARNRRSAGLSCHPRQTVIPSHTAGFWFRSVRRFVHGLCPTFQPLTNSEKGAEAPKAGRPSR